ncbi:MAG UNVERIFIED_CONTAM: hypothetical protein LVR18_13855 [Planctomycetaceae bacterium]
MADSADPAAPQSSSHRQSRTAKDQSQQAEAAAGHSAATAPHPAFNHTVRQQQLRQNSSTRHPVKIYVLLDVLG